MIALAFRGLAVEVARGVRALDGIDGELAPGRVTAVVGPSGAGKSTLLAVLAGLRRPDHGVVELDGEDVTRWAPERRRLGVVFQDLRLFPFMTGRENVAFGPRVLGVAPAERHRRVEAALELTRAAAFADRPVSVLSGGERQRIAVARALAIEPRGLLLDEPFVALDAELRRGLREELSELVRRLGVTTLLVTHDRDDAFALASHLLVLRAGRIEQAGEVARCYEEPASAYVATLLGEAAVLPVAERDGERALVGGAWLPVGGRGGSVVLRPERLRLAEEGEAATWSGALVDARFVAGRWRVVVEVPGAGPVVALVDRAPAGGAVSLCVRGALPTV